MNSTILESITHVNFSECEKVLREHYKIPESTIMTFLQIELENNNSKSLINQVEYQAYDGNKTLLDLSLCKDVNIKVFYSIKENSSSLLDLDLVSRFKENGIDIFNINDSFFNDICKPYSESNNDLILDDRIKEIYQNYSLCENECNLENIESEMISCECKVKSNVNTSISEPNLVEVEGSSTNLAIFKCYNLVFSLEGKLNNYGFWILGILVLAHAPILFYYFCIGIKPVKEYIFNEMKKYGYIKDNKSKINNKKKNKRSKIRKIKNASKNNENLKLII